MPGSNPPLDDEVENCSSKISTKFNVLYLLVVTVVPICIAVCNVFDSFCCHKMFSFAVKCKLNNFGCLGK